MNLLAMISSSDFKGKHHENRLSTAAARRDRRPGDSPRSNARRFRRRPRSLKPGQGVGGTDVVTWG